MKVCLSFFAAALATQSAMGTEAASPWGPPIAEYGGALPKSGPWIGLEDYPESPTRRTDEGRVVLSFSITAHGRLTECRVTKSSGSAWLDGVPCLLLERRARFLPARDRNGNAIATVGKMSVDFVVPR
ncbi:TonB family protein [Novosphingobium sp.]|uniref:TonB family protein n=1 Tax=Novosphingobium sp. TaxID=1874826 RepID=UPI00301890C4